MKTKSFENNPERVYGAIINLSGLSFVEPKRFRYNYELNSWWYRGNYGIDKLGINKRGGCITFASIKKSEVEHFINGAKAVLGMLQEWSKT